MKTTAAATWTGAAPARRRVLPWAIALVLAVAIGGLFLATRTPPAPTLAAPQVVESVEAPVSTPVPSTTIAPSVAAAPSPSVAPKPKPKTAPKTNCTPPYKIGKDGVKVFKPECL